MQGLHVLNYCSNLQQTTCDDNQEQKMTINSILFLKLNFYNSYFWTLNLIG